MAANTFFMPDDEFVMDDLPESVMAALEVRDKYLRSLGSGYAGLEFMVADKQRWEPGSSIRVAFLSGSKELHKEIADATKQITDCCNIILDFGVDDEGNYRSWSEEDKEYQADIRVSFDMKGNWSLVGTDSRDSQLGRKADKAGGRPHQRSLNLGGYDVYRPMNWKGTVRHEFLHALGVKHEHQNMRGPCQSEFRWEDDEGYRPTQDSREMYVKDSEGRRPGIYTYLAGFPNFWSKAKVDHNLLTRNDPNATAGPFDRKSVMLYRFPRLFYKNQPSPCAPDGAGVELSEGDKRGLVLLYGKAQAAAHTDGSIPGALESMEFAPLHEVSASTASDSLLGWLSFSDNIPKLPQNDDKINERTEALTRQRQAWKNTPYKGKLAATDGVPSSERPSLPWLSKVGVRSAQIALNELEVRARWGSAAPDSGGGLESFDRHAAMLSHERSLHQDFLDRYRRLENLNADLPDSVLEGLAEPTRVSESQRQKMIEEVQARIAAIAGGRVQPQADFTGLEGLTEAAVEMFSGPQGRPTAVADYNRLFRNFELPAIASTWQTDETFAWLRLAGPNARVIRGIAEVPDNFKVTDEGFKQAMFDSNDGLRQAGEEGRLFLCDYKLVSETLEANVYKSQQKYISGPMALFAVPREGGRLRPVAIQCQQDPDPQTNPVFYPMSGNSWALAKQVVQAADGNHHELISHLARTHLYTEVFALASHRNLAPNHPLTRLLLPHFEGTVFINNSARGDLINEGGAIDQIFAGKVETAQALAVKGVESYHFMENLLPVLLDSAKTEAIEDYPYRDDSRLLWDAIHAWVNSYVRLYYRTANDLQADTELRAWNDQLRKPVVDGGIPGFPRIENRETLVKVLTRIIFVASCQHAAVNFPQLTDMSYAPAISGAGWRTLPHSEEQITVADRLNFMPPLELAMKQASVLLLLGGVQHTRLGDYKSNSFPYSDWFSDPAVNENLLPVFRKKLEDIEAVINQRNSQSHMRWRPYTHLLPSKVPMSINI